MKYNKIELLVFIILLILSIIIIVLLCCYGSYVAEPIEYYPDKNHVLELPILVNKNICNSPFVITENIDESSIVINNELNITISKEDDNRLFDEDKLHRIMSKIKNLNYDSE